MSSSSFPSPGKVWPCVLLHGSCGQRVWLCRNWPMQAAEAETWIETAKKEHEASLQPLKGQFVSECVSHAGFMDYLRANPTLPAPRIWVSK